MRLIPLVIIILWSSGSAISQTKYPKTVIIDTSFSVFDYLGDTVTMYAPSQIIKIGKRLMTASALEQELGIYKVLYSHCDSLRVLKDSTQENSIEIISLLEKENYAISQQLQIESEHTLRLSEIITRERKKNRRQKFIYAFSGTGVGIIGGIILGIVVR